MSIATTVLKLAAGLSMLGFAVYQVQEELPTSGQGWPQFSPASLAWFALALMLFNTSQWASAQRFRLFYRQDFRAWDLGFMWHLRLYYCGMYYGLFLPGGLGGDGYKVWRLRKLIKQNIAGDANADADADITGKELKLEVSAQPYTARLIRLHLVDRLSGLTGLLSCLITLGLWSIGSIASLESTESVGSTGPGLEWFDFGSGSGLDFGFSLDLGLLGFSCLLSTLALATALLANLGLALVMLFLRASVNSRLLCQTGLWSLLVQVLQVACVQALLGVWHVDTHPGYLVLFLASSLASVVPITIGGIGLRELVFVSGAPWLGVDGSTALCLSLSFLSISALSALPGAFLGSAPKCSANANANANADANANDA